MGPARNNNPDSSSKSAQEAVLFESTALATAIAFFAGWEYARAYYGTFGLSMDLLEIQIPTFFVWSYRPIIHYWYWAGFLLLAFAVLNFIRQSITGWVLSIVNFILICLLLLAFPATSSLSRTVGTADGSRDITSPSDAFPLVTLHLKDPDRAIRNSLREAIGVIHEGQYYLLGLHHQMYFFLPISQREDQIVLFVPSESISSVIVRRNGK
jgi:hypothetical protein